MRCGLRPSEMSMRRWLCAEPELAMCRPFSMSYILPSTNNSHVPDTLWRLAVLLSCDVWPTEVLHELYEVHAHDGLHACDDVLRGMFDTNLE